MTAAQIIAILGALGAALAAGLWIGLQVAEYRRAQRETRAMEWMRWQNDDLLALLDRMTSERRNDIAGTRR